MIGADLAEVLTHLTQGARGALGEDLLGAYLVGSFALGAGDGASDVDFLVVVRAAPTPGQEALLRDLHARLPDLGPPWARHLEGSYAPREQLGRAPVAGGGWLYVDNGSRVMEFSSHDDSLVVRWVTREHGIVLAGPPAREFVAEVTPQQLSTDAHVVLARWDADLRARPGQFRDLLAQQQHVLGLCRLLHRARSGRVLSKVAAAQWFTSNPAQQRWAPLVTTAVAGRARAWDRGDLATAPEVVAETIAFHHHVVGLLSRAGPAGGR